MNNRIKMLIDTVFEKASIALSVGDAIATLPVTNLQKDSNSDVFRTTSKTFVIEGDFDALTLVSACVLWRHTLSSTATIRFELFDAIGQGGNELCGLDEQPALPPLTMQDWQWQTQPITASVMEDWSTKYSQIWLSKGYFARSYRITITDVNNTESHVDITRIFMGRHFEPAINFSYGHELVYNSSSEQFRTDGGSLYGEEKPLYREASFSLNYISEADRPLLSNAIRAAGLHKDWFISMFPNLGTQKEFEHAFACKFTNHAAVKAVAYNMFSTDLEIGES